MREPLRKIRVWGSSNRMEGSGARQAADVKQIPTVSQHCFPERPDLFPPKKKSELQVRSLEGA